MNVLLKYENAPTVTPTNYEHSHVLLKDENAPTVTRPTMDVLLKVENALMVTLDLLRTFS